MKQGAAIGGWVCFGLGVVFMIIPIPTWFICGPLFLASFILSIVAISQRRIASGVTLLLANVVGAPILFAIALPIGIAAWKGVFDSARQQAAEHSNILVTNRASEPSPNRGVSESEAGVASPSRPVSAPTENIRGAFGKMLGEPFDPADAIGTSKLTDGTPMYEFSTTTGFRSFQRYYLMITPTTHKIYSIWGRGSVESSEAGKKEQAVIMELLKQKYGAEEKEALFDAMGDVKRIEQGDRYIITKISGFTDVTLEIRYYDEGLEKLAETERLAEETRKADKSGL